MALTIGAGQSVTAGAAVYTAVGTRTTVYEGTTLGVGIQITGCTYVAGWTAKMGGWK